MLPSTYLKVSATDVRNTIVHRQGFSTNYEGLHEIISYSENPYNVANSSIIKFSGEVEEEYTTEYLLSHQHKIFWWGNIGLYNLFFERFSHLINEVKRHDDPLVVINDSNLWWERDFAYYKFFLKSLTDAGIKWKVYNNKNKIYARNFSIIDNFCVTPENIKLVKDHCTRYVKDKNIKPFRKVYLSRRHIPNRDYKWIKEGISSRSDNRLFDHDVLEKFLSENGFEVIVPEEEFINFEDQIQYFYETETLVSLSSSGIANALFMQPSTSVIEFMTTYPMGFDSDNFSEEPESMEGAESIHHLYHTLSYVNNNCYFAIPNLTRYSKDIIDNIEKNSNFRKIFMEK